MTAVYTEPKTWSLDYSRIYSAEPCSSRQSVLASSIKATQARLIAALQHQHIIPAVTCSCSFYTYRSYVPCCRSDGYLPEKWYFFGLSLLYHIQYSLRRETMPFFLFFVVRNQQSAVDQQQQQQQSGRGNAVGVQPRLMQIILNQVSYY